MKLTTENVRLSKNDQGEKSLEDIPSITLHIPPHLIIYSCGRQLAMDPYPSAVTTRLDDGHISPLLITLTKVFQLYRSWTTKRTHDFWHNNALPDLRLKSTEELLHATRTHSSSYGPRKHDRDDDDEGDDYDIRSAKRQKQGQSSCALSTNSNGEDEGKPTAGNTAPVGLETGEYNMPSLRDLRRDSVETSPSVASWLKTQHLIIDDKEQFESNLLSDHDDASKTGRNGLNKLTDAQDVDIITIDERPASIETMVVDEKGWPKPLMTKRYRKTLASIIRRKEEEAYFS